MHRADLFIGARQRSPTPEAVSTLTSVRAAVQELLGDSLDILEEDCTPGQMDAFRAKVSLGLQALLARGFQFQVGVTNGWCLGKLVPGQPLPRDAPGLREAMVRRANQFKQNTYNIRQQTTKDGYFFAGEEVAFPASKVSGGGEKHVHLVGLTAICLTRCTDKTSSRRIDDFGLGEGQGDGRASGSRSGRR